ncbi:MAG TPA: 16S rRNA (guanine(966)-N(2))-methyltransferase RsmD [Acidimicrobiia bacterium]|nr:16S rRNA (guanine(966)-N(2))-methyltransferase RsmD [Acidimicrobiia bacterium]
MTSRRGARGMRVIAGTARGRRLVTPAGDDVRPTKDMVREAMFSALDARDAVVGATVLDLYAGSGALAIEALSRGATRAVVVEHSRAAVDAINANVELLALGERLRLVAGDVGRFLAGGPPAEAPFGLVMADPPYGTTDETVTSMLVALARPGWVAADAIVTVERPARRPVEAPPGWSCGWERTFGDTLLAFLFREVGSRPGGTTA